MAELLNDHDLVRACRAGDAEAFGTLVRRHQDRLYPAILRLLGLEEDARDVLQDAFVRAYVKLDQFQGTSSFYTWIYRIAINLAVSRQRRRRPRLIDFRDRRRHDDSPTNPADASREADPSVAYDRVEREQQIREALAALSPEHRAVVVLKDLEDHRYEEIAEILNIPVGTVRSRLHRARCELRQLLCGLFADDYAASETQVTR
jgi:RNA polymerase sigma-70 factor (ECF subfamily)